ncbi:MAG: DNA polymerase Y family protein [Woeseiaceae bacterium]|nr:DNA polymerase Y family protein [Woeseiaceae bacterium]
MTRRDANPTPAVRHPVRQRPVQQTLSLAPANDALPRRLPPSRAVHADALWLCLYLPALPLEAARRPADAGEANIPYAVFEEQQGVRQILMATPAAEAAGVHAGLPVNAALALVPGLLLAERDGARERRQLETLAAWAERYTSFVVSEPPATLLLEIAASLRLFNGLRALRRQIVTALAARGHRAQPAIAPTPLAATWLARAGSRRCLVDAARLNSALAGLPLDCLDWPARLHSTLRGMGVACVGDLLRLPRAGFARRFGADRLLALDRALGRAPDPRRHFRAPPRFCENCDLDAEQSDSELLLGACEHLLTRLEHFLRTRQLAAQRLHFRFFHRHEPATPLTLGCLQAGQNSARWLELLRLRLEALALPAPVIAIRLCAGDEEGNGHCQPFVADTAGLALAGGERASAPATRLVERLAARIGEAAVHGVDTVAEHRPEYAWQARHAPEELPQCRAATAPLPGGQAALPHGTLGRAQRLLLRRPLWMLERPEALACRGQRPCYRGVLTFAAGPERIETGWWDADGIARDYYVVRNPDGCYLWIFKNRGGDRGWYLHGMFG